MSFCGFTEGVLPSALSIKERRSRAIEEERRLTYVAVTRAEKRFYITDSEGYNFTMGLNKYPSRFLFEISEEFYIRKGKLALKFCRALKYLLEIWMRKTRSCLPSGIWFPMRYLKKGESRQSIWIKTNIQIDFFEIGKEKPIDFNFRFLKKIDDNSISESNENEDADSSQDLQYPFEVPEKSI